jgi:hypothetical protein
VEDFSHVITHTHSDGLKYCARADFLNTPTQRKRLENNVNRKGWKSIEVPPTWREASGDDNAQKLYPIEDLLKIRNGD